jgi:hypothetical protein
MGRKWANEPVDELVLRMKKDATFQEVVRRAENVLFVKFYLVETEGCLQRLWDKTRQSEGNSLSSF